MTDTGLKPRALCFVYDKEGDNVSEKRTWYMLKTGQFLYHYKVEKSSTMKSRDVYLFLAWREQSLNTGNAFNVQFMTKTGFILQLFSCCHTFGPWPCLQMRCKWSHKYSYDFLSLWLLECDYITTYYYKFQKFNWNAIHLHRLFTANTCLAFVWFLSQFLLSFGFYRKSFDFSTIFLYLPLNLV